MEVNHDGDAIGGAVAGGVGGLTQWLRSPEGWKKLGGWVGAGAVCGFLTNAALRHWLSDWEWDLRWGVASFAGLGSATLIVFAMKQITKMTDWGDHTVNNRLGIPTAAGVVVNGQSTPAGTVTTVGVAAAVVTVAEVGTGGGVVGHGVVSGDELGSKRPPAAGGQ